MVNGNEEIQLGDRSTASCRCRFSSFPVFGNTEEVEAQETEMAIPQRSPHKSSSKKKPLEVKKLLMRKPPVLACNKAKKEDINNFKIPTIRKTGKNSASMGYRKTSASVLHRANEVQAKLPSEFASCVKLMLPSHVTGGFWLGLPKQFCDLHLPKHDAAVFLVDENDEEYYTKYLIEKNGLSAGWRGFSIAHNLLQGDAVIFQVIKPCRIKVYIVRANSLSEIDGATSLLNLDFQAKPTKNVVSNIVKRENEDAEEVKNFSITAQMFMKPNTNNSQEEATTKNCLIALNSDNLPNLDAQSENESDLVPALDLQSGNEKGDLGSEILGGIRFSESVIDFKDVKDFESFNILVDGLVIDCEIPKHLKPKYYELCCSQNSFLHNHLIKGLNCKLAAGIISETINIADAIRASKLDTGLDYLQTWDKTLKAFEDMGMAVGFLRERIKKLVCLQCEEQEIIKSKSLERAQAEMDKKKLEAELSRVKEVIKTLDTEIEALKVRNERLILTFKEMATAPW